MKYIYFFIMLNVLVFANSNIDCSKKYYCSHFDNCKEAMAYLKKCKSELNGGNQRTDGDNDGIPCERQHCGHITPR